MNTAWEYDEEPAPENDPTFLDRTDRLCLLGALIWVAVVLAGVWLLLR